MPTRRGQSVLVYALNALLLTNLTVIVLILSGELLGKAEAEEPVASQAPVVETVAALSSEPVEVQREALPAQEAADEPIAPAVSEPVEPVVAVTQAPAVEPEPAVTKTLAAPEQADKPVTFFGIGLE